MKTPAGHDCPYFYGNYFRGRSQEECRLLKPAGQPWSAGLCKTCPVPAISRANSCQNLVLRPQVTRSLFNFFQARVQISAWCTKSEQNVAEPQLGCGQCHSLPPIFDTRKTP